MRVVYGLRMGQRLLVVGIVLAGLCVQARAICPDPVPLPCHLFHRSKATFIGTVMAEKAAPGDRKHDDGIVYTLSVVKVFRGAAARTIRVFTERNSGGEYLRLGKTYIVFAMQGDRKHPLEISCRLTEEIQDVEAATHMLEAVSRQKGNVLLRGKAEDRSAPVAGAIVQVQGSQTKLKLVTDEHGRFEVDVPAGKYKVTVRGNDGRPMRQTDYNFLIDADNFTAEPGECVDLIFEYATP